MLYRQREATLLVALALVVIVMTAVNSRFLSASNVQDMLMNVAILAIIAVGQTFVVLTRNIDLSVGANIAVSAFVAGDYLRSNPDGNLLVVLLLSSFVGLLLGVLNAVLVTFGGLPSVVATLGTLYVYRGIVALLTEGTNSINAFQLPESFANFGQSKLLGVSVLAWIALVVVVIAAYVLRYTRPGRDIYAIGSNADAARLAGVPVQRRVFTAFALSGMLSGLCGALWTAQYLNVNSVTASGFEFIVIAAVVVGGVNIFGGSGTVLGAALGALILISIQSGLNLLKVSPFWISAIYGAAILVAVAVDGLLSRRIHAALTAGRRT
ncbi:MAG: rhamnose transport system permease protein [Actinomycetota bacterium]|jgi:rhamnose transport system permease protein|nr:rhamnose transport system permease protein [Actinomycetota bacterium]